MSASAFLNSAHLNPSGLKKVARISVPLESIASKSIVLVVFEITALASCVKIIACAEITDIIIHIYIKKIPNKIIIFVTHVFLWTHI